MGWGEWLPLALSRLERGRTLGGAAPQLSADDFPHTRAA